MPPVLDYQSRGQRKTKLPRADLRMSGPRSKSGWCWWTTPKLILVLAVTLFVFLIVHRYRSEASRQEWLAESKLQGGFLPDDKVIHVERAGWRDPYSFHELQVTPATFQRIHVDVTTRSNHVHAVLEAEYGAKSDRYLQFFEDFPLERPSWLVLPKDAEVVTLQMCTYAFIKRTGTVFIYRWSM